MPVSRRRHRTRTQLRESRRTRAIMRSLHQAYVAALRGLITAQVFERIRNAARAEMLGLDPLAAQQS